jgi:hypothetical protein
MAIHSRSVTYTLVKELVVGTISSVNSDRAVSGKTALLYLNNYVSRQVCSSTSVITGASVTVCARSKRGQCTTMQVQ